MIKPKEYHVYRYFIQINEQLSFNSEGIKRKDILNYLIEILNEKDKIKYEYRNKSYILYPLIRLDRELYICKFSKEKQIKRHHEGNTDINEEKEPDYPYVYVIIDILSQMILIQKNTNVFSDTISCKNRLQDLFKKILGSFTYKLVIESVTDKEQFWNTIKSASKVYNFKLKLNAPNLFGAKVKANLVRR